jgi:hypothetical protein
VCGIRWTPDERAVAASDYYQWIVCGMELYAALADGPARLIEVFPTASWTRWRGKRGSRSRAAWTVEGLGRLDLSDVPVRTSQDQRDAIAAAVTARELAYGNTEEIGEIIVPRPHSSVIGAIPDRSGRGRETSGR